MKRPECYHISPLYEGQDVLTAWGVNDAETNYIIERVFNESFSQALTGYTWDNLDSSDESWEVRDRSGQNWHQLDTRIGRGRSWERRDYDGFTWARLDDSGYTWKESDNLEISFEIFRGRGNENHKIGKGRTWTELDLHMDTWSGMAMTGHTWAEAELVTLPGLSWDCLESMWLTCEEWEGRELTFAELEHLVPADVHQSMTDTVPIGAENAMYRIKALGPEGEESDYLTTLQQPVTPIFYRKGTAEYPVEAGKRYLIALRADEVCGLDKVRLTLRYDPHLLELVSVAADSKWPVAAPGNYPEEQVRIDSMEPGKVWFQSTKLLEPEESFSGLITVVELRAKGWGRAAVSLS